jgi:hypothetical protein
LLDDLSWNQGTGDGDDAFDCDIIIKNEVDDNQGCFHNGRGLGECPIRVTPTR